MKLKIIFCFTITFVAALENLPLEDIFSSKPLSDKFVKRFHDFVKRDNPDVLSEVPDILKRHGYKFKAHTVTTSDGYILTLFQLFAKKRNSKTPVFLQHGICQNSAVWVDIGERSLAFQLVKQGYEVWLGNVRGTEYSQNHTKISVNNPAYWNFTLDTLAKNDIMSQLTTVYTETKQKIHYIGHSMGTTLAFMFSSWYPHKAEKMIKSLIMLAPIAYLNNDAFVKTIRTPMLLIINLLEALNEKGVFYRNHKIHMGLVAICTVIPDVCLQALNMVFGKSVQTSKENTPIFVSYWPQGTSIYQYKQHLQISLDARFQMYDFGESNMKVYGTKQPPAYDLSNIKIPTCLLYGEEDSFYDPQDVKRLFNEIGSTNKCKYSIPSANSSEKFSHIDFIYSDKIIESLYQRIFKILEEFEK